MFALHGVQLGRKFFNYFGMCLQVLRRLAFDCGGDQQAGRQLQGGVDVRCDVVQRAFHRCLHLACMHQHATAGAAQVKVQQCGVIGHPGVDAALQLFLRRGGLPQGHAGQHSFRRVVNQHKDDLRVLLFPIVQQINGFGVCPTPQGLGEVSEHQIQHHALPDGRHFDLL